MQPFRLFFLFLLVVSSVVNARQASPSEKINNQLELLRNQLYVDLNQATTALESLNINSREHPEAFFHQQSLLCLAYFEAGNTQGVTNATAHIADAQSAKVWRFWAELVSCQVYNDLLSGNTSRASKASYRLYQQSEAIDSDWVKVLAALTQANVLVRIGNEQKALALLEPALKVAVESLQDLPTELDIRINIANLYSQTEKKYQAIDLYHQVIDDLDKLGQHLGKAVVYFNIGHTFMKVGKYPQALENFEKARALYDNHAGEIGVAIVDLGIAELHAHTHDFEKALILADRAEAVFREKQQQADLFDVLLVKGVIYRGLGQFDLSLQYMHTADKLAFLEHEKFRRIELYKELASTYAATQDYEQAFSFLDKHQLLEQMKVNQAIQQQLEHFELAEEERKNQLLERENQIKTLMLNQQKANFRYSMLASLCLVVIVLVLLKLVQKERRLTNKLGQLAITDELTQTNNRRQIMAMVDHEASLFRRHGHLFSVIIFDIDHFKQINDQYGHGAGDFVLVEMTKIVTAILRNEDHLGRIGGEEFLVVLPMTNLAQAQILAERIRIAIADKPFCYQQHQLQVTASLGVSQLAKRHESSKDMLQEADNALYQAKAKGRNQVALYDSVLGVAQSEE